MLVPLEVREHCGVLGPHDGGSNSGVPGTPPEGICHRGLMGSSEMRCHRELLGRPEGRGQWGTSEGTAEGTSKGLRGLLRDCCGFPKREAFRWKIS